METRAKVMGEAPLRELPDPALEVLWKHVLDHWEDDAAHAAFLERCQATDRLVEAAVRYRGMTGDRDRSETAQKRLNGVALLAMAKLETVRTPAPKARAIWTSVLLIALFLAGSFWLLMYLMRS